MELRDLKYFLAVAETGQIHAAALRVGRTQPAITKCIRRLESELDARLFEKAGRGIKLTAVGEALLVKAQMICRVVDDALRDVREAACGRAGHVRIGAGPTAASGILSDLLSSHLREHPGLTVSVHSAMRDELRRKLRNAELDIVFAPVSGTDIEFASIPLLDDFRVVAARAGHPLAGRKVRIGELRNYRWVLPFQSYAATEWMNQAFLRHRLPAPKIQISANGVLPLVGVVAKSDLLTFVSRNDLAKEPGALQEVQVEELVMPRQLGVLYDADRDLPAAAKVLIEAVRRSVARKGARDVIDAPLGHPGARPSPEVMHD